MGTRDCFYRFRRDFELTSTVVYVHLQTLDIIAQDRRTYGPEVIKDLRNNVEVWDQQWTTLTVFREDRKAQYTQDQWKPHFLPPDAALGNLPRLNVLDLEIRHGFKNRVFLVQLEAQRQILKICPFCWFFVLGDVPTGAYGGLRGPTGAYRGLGVPRGT